MYKEMLKSVAKYPQTAVNIPGGPSYTRGPVLEKTVPALVPHGAHVWSSGEGL
jgi:hypothetical protein